MAWTMDFSLLANTVGRNSCEARCLTVSMRRSPGHSVCESRVKGALGFLSETHSVMFHSLLLTVLSFKSAVLKVHIIWDGRGTRRIQVPIVWTDSPGGSVQPTQWVIKSWWYFSIRIMRNQSRSHLSDVYREDTGGESLILIKLNVHCQE